MTDQEAADLYRTDRDAWKAYKAEQAAQADRIRDEVRVQLANAR